MFGKNNYYYSEYVKNNIYEKEFIRENSENLEFAEKYKKFYIKMKKKENK